MTDKEIKRYQDRILTLLAERRLKPAFDLIASLIKESGQVVFSEELNRLGETYQNMLKYTLDGVQDPERQKVYNHLVISAFSLTDRVLESIKLKHSLSTEYSMKRNFRSLASESLSMALKQLEAFFNVQTFPDSDLEFAKERKQQDEQMNALSDMRNVFYQVWFTDQFSVDDIKQLEHFLDNQSVPLHYRSFLVTAVILSIQRFFDPGKFSLLLGKSQAGPVAISQRALTGLMTALYRYDRRIGFYPEVSGRLKMMFADREFRQNVLNVITQFIRSKGTEKLQQRIREELLPDMIRISSNLRDKINLDSLMEDGLSEDRNPDWEDVFRDSPEVMKKFEEFSEMQMKGDDVYMGSFAMLKSFPFFNETSNWFIPFFPENPEIRSGKSFSGKAAGIMSAIAMAPMMCNSDKYSFCLSLERIPEENLNMINTAMGAEIEQLKEMMAGEEWQEQSKKAGVESNIYIQDLYRFYKLFPRKADFEDIFEWRLDFHHLNSISALFQEDASLLPQIAEYYLLKENYTEAAEIFTSLPESQMSEELYQKTGWCFQKTENYEKALEYYLRAELAGTPKAWTLGKIARCYRQLRKPEKAYEYYRLAEKAEPDNLGIQLSIGHCLLDLERYEEALQCYFKVEYLAPGNTKVWRPLGWCSFITGKTEQAEKYFLKIMEAEPKGHDFINMGHVQWSLGNRRKALDYYLKAIGNKGFTEEEFLKIFDEDKTHLLARGIDPEDIPIMLDQLRFLAE